MAQKHRDETDEAQMMMMQELTQRFTAVQSRSKAAGVGVDGDVGGRGVQQRVPDDDRVDDTLAGDGVEHCCAHIR